MMGVCKYSSKKGAGYGIELVQGKTNPGAGGA
jgi:hypothetical protein